MKFRLIIILFSLILFINSSFADSIEDSQNVSSGYYFWDLFLLWLITIVIMIIISIGDQK